MLTTKVIIFVLLCIAVVLQQSVFGFTVQSSFKNRVNFRLAMSNKNEAAPSPLQRVRQILTKKTASFLAAASLTASFMLPGAAFASSRNNNKQPTALTVSQIFSENQREENKATVVAKATQVAQEHTAVIEIHSEDKEVAKKQGKLLNRVGLVFLVGNVVYSVVKNDGSKSKKGKANSKSRQIRAPKTLNFEEDKLKGIMSKLEETLKEQEENVPKKKVQAVRKTPSVPAIDPDNVLEQEIEQEEVSPRKVEERKDYSPYKSSRPKGLSAKLANAEKGIPQAPAPVVQPPNSLDTTASIDDDQPSAEEQKFLESIENSRTLISEPLKNEEPKIPEKKGIFDRIFKKTTSSLAIDLGDLLSREDKAQVILISS